MKEGVKIDAVTIFRRTKYAVENVFNVIDRRYRSGKPLIITTKLHLSTLINMLKKGIHESHNKVHKSHATKVKFKCDKELVCNIDGEIMKDKKFSVKIIPNSLTIYNDKELIKEFLR